MDFSIQRLNPGVQIPKQTMENLVKELKKLTVTEPDFPGKLDREYWYQHFDELLEKLNLTIEVFQIEFKREIHQGTGELMVSVINRQTGEVLRQVPPEKILDMLAAMMKQLGLAVDLQA